MKKVVVGIISKKIDNEISYLLVCSKKDFGQYTGCYYPPGGHLECNETEEEALKRELKEELGVIIEPKVKIAETSSDVEGQITSWWDCQILSGEPGIIDQNEIADFGYFNRKEMEILPLWPSTKNMLNQIFY